jgi:uncharacterized membrane protein HdeD (DUF308 family)
LAGDSTITKLLPAELGSLTEAVLLFAPLALVDLRLAVVFLAAALGFVLVVAGLLVVIYRFGFSYPDVVHISDLFDLSF